MPVNGFSVGKDVSLVLVSPQGPLDVSLVTEFMSKMDTIEIKIKGLDGVTRHVRFPDGWSGTFAIEREGPIIDNYFALIEADYYAGVDSSLCSLTEIIAEPDGSITEWRYLNVLLKYDDAGAWGGDKTVKQKLSFVSETRLKIQ